jgi:polyhydroxyalkanoate synthesis repressor PhaR
MQSSQPTADPKKTDSNGAESPKAVASIVIKKYANRRLYNTSTSSYVTLDHLSDLVKSEVPFTVQDAKTGEDITRQVLTQIIFEHENRGQNILPAEFLRQIIRFYGDNLQGFLPAYLNMSIDTFSRSQERMRDAMTRALGGTGSVNLFEEQMRQNMVMFENAVKMFSPFAATRQEATTKSEQAGAMDSADIADLKRQLESMQKQLDAIASKKS